jgi:hypothetical protein
VRAESVVGGPFGIDRRFGVDRRLALGGPGVTGRRVRVRLTRRGRAVVLILFLLLAGLGLALAAPASRAAGPAGDPPTAEVHPGDTLWSIAERELPGRDPIGAVEEIRELNGLAGNTIHAGQHIVLPRRR